MFDGLEYFADENAAAEEEYAKVRDVVREARDATRDAREPWPSFVHRTAGFLTDVADLEERLVTDRFATASIEDLAAENAGLFADLEPESYGVGFADPAYAASRLGDDVGPLASLLVARFRELTGAAFRHKRFELARDFRRFLEVVALGEVGAVTAEALRETAIRHDREDRTEDYLVAIRERFDPACRFGRDIAEGAEPGDLRALYRYGAPVSDHDLRTARFIAEWTQNRVDRIADAMLAAYIRGFEIDNKDLTAKSSVMVVGRLGYERVFARLFAGLESEGLAPVYVAAPAAKLNRQFDYDHRFDYAISLDRDLVDSWLASFKIAIDRTAGMLRACSGMVILQAFGEPPFSPMLKDVCITADETTAALQQELEGRKAQMSNEVCPREEQSFSIVAFPSPEIRGDFEAIFEDTLEINMLENARYERIQHELILALDRADHVRVTGREGNRTDLTVMLPPLDDPATQTNFVNCVADVNIPLGEVFTSPRLTGTRGVLHVEEVFLKGLRFQDLEITFEDGCITACTCGNFEDEAENRKYVHENVIYPHDSLPIGEFAIGTNTLAYAMAKRHGIMDVLPVLIIEKMGPHLAVGDTCFSWQEDHAIHNPLDGREVVARENERSCVRREDPAAAYTNTHTDITLPYSSLDTIAAVLPSGEEIPIIRGGRFVLPGTEELNAPIDEVDE